MKNFKNLKEVNNKGLRVLNILRDNCRENTIKISRSLNISPITVSTKIKELEDNVIHKHTAILDFFSLGFNVWVVLEIGVEKREEFFSYIIDDPRLNSLYIIQNSNFLIEMVFKTMKEFYDFTDYINKFKIRRLNKFFVINDIKRENMKISNNSI